MKIVKYITMTTAFLFFVLCASACTPASKNVSDTISYVIDGTSLVIIGSGSTPDYDVDEKTAAPWADREPYSSKTLTVKKAVIGEGISYLGEDSFLFFTELTDVDLPDSLTDIGRMCFYGCEKLKRIDLSENLKSIGAFAFNECSSLSTINLPEGLEEIGESAFSRCDSLETIYIPSTVTEIGDWVFDHCQALKEIIVSPENERYYSSDGVLFDRIMNELVAYPAARDAETYSIPDGIERIGEGAFTDCHLTETDIPSTVLSIENCAFFKARNLSRITLPDKLTAIKYGVFIKCENLEYIRVPDSCACLNAGAFDGCNKLALIDISPDNLYLCNKDGVIYNKDQTTLLLYPPALTDKVYVAPESLEEIADYAIMDNQFLTTVVLPKDMNRIGKDSFQDMPSLKTVQMPERLYSIGEGSFEGCEVLKQITIPHLVTVIPFCTFSFCEELEEVTVPNTVERIEKHAFIGFHGKLVFEGTKNEWKSICIEDKEILNRAMIEYSAVDCHR